MAKVKVNYRNNKRSILTSIILILCLGFSGISLVYSAANSNGGTGGSINYPDAEEGSNTTYSAVRYGLRLSLVDNNGEQIGHSIDFWPSYPIGESSTADKMIHAVTVNGNYGTIRQNQSGTIAITNTGVPASNFSTEFCNKDGVFKNCQVMYNNSGELIGLWMYGMGTLFKHPKDIQSVANTIVSEINSPDPEKSKTAENNINIYLRELTGVKSENLDDLQNIYDTKYDEDNPNAIIKDSINDRYFQFEPVILFRSKINGNATWFYGSLTELVTAQNIFATSIIGGVSSGIYIQKDIKPTIFKKHNSVTYSTSEIGQVSSNGPDSIPGQAVSHVWLKELNIKVSCTPELIAYIEEKYTIGTKEYHEAIERVKNGTFNESVSIDLENDVTKTYLVTSPQSFNLLEREIYETYNGGVAKCENINIPDPPECSPEVDKNIDPCVTGYSYFKESNNPNDWLICGISYIDDLGNFYSSENTGHESVEDGYGNVVGNNKYCEIFCYEGVESKFPSKVSGVKAGQTFLWGDPTGVFGDIKIEKHCSTRENGYKFDEWHTDYKANEKSKIENYLLWHGYEDAYDEIETDHSYGCCIVCCDDDDDDGCKEVKGYSGEAKSPSKTNTYSSDGWLREIKRTSLSQDGDADCYSDSGSAEEAAKAVVEGKLDALIETHSEAYQTADTAEIPKLKDIFQCFSNMKYVYKTMVEFVFEEPINSVYGANSRALSGTWEMLLDSSQGYNEVNFVNDNKCEIKIVHSYKCEGEAENAECNIGGYTSSGIDGIEKSTVGGTGVHEVVDCDQAIWRIEGTYTYSYPVEEFQWFSDKRDSTLVNKQNKPAGEEAYFYSIGFGLPTAFSLTSGKYEMAVVVGGLGDYSTIRGEQPDNGSVHNYNSENGHFYPVTDLITGVEINKNTISVDQVYGFEYKCTYEVENEIFGYDCVYDGDNLTGNSPAYCDEKKDNDSNGNLKGIDVAYRIVSLLNEKDELEKAFPGIDSSGRNIGDNWNKIGIDEIYKILDDDVYESLAMYEIMLDINAIRYIRKNNNQYYEYNRDPYTSYVDAFGHQKVYCKSKGNNGEDKYCASEFLTELNTSSSLNYNLMGTCLPSGMGTEERAQHELDDECSNTYVYPKISWVR